MTRIKRKIRRKGNGGAPFPRPAAPADDMVEQVASELEEMADMLFWDHPAHSADDKKELAKGKAAWAHKMTKMLVFIRSRDDLTESQKEDLITALWDVCLLSDVSVTVERDAIDRYERGLVKARAAKARARRRLLF